MVVFSFFQKCESAYKRGSVVPAIYLRLLLPGGSIVLPSDAKSLRSYLDGQPSVVGIHALSPSATHTAAITGCGRELLPRVLTLTLLIYIIWRLFSSALRHPRGYFPLGSGVSCGAPTFLLPCLLGWTSDRPAGSRGLCFRLQR